MLKFDINLLFTVINLFVLFFIIWKFLFKPVKKIIAKRQEEVEQQYKDAENVRAEADATKAQYDEALSGAAAEGDKIIKDSRTKAGEEYDRIVADARNEAEGILDGARKDALEERQQTLKQTKDEIADIVGQAAAKLASAKEDPQADLKLFDEFIAKSGE